MLTAAVVQVAGLDPLRDEGIAYAKALEAAAVPVTLKIYPGLPHGFYLMPNLKQTKKYRQSVVDFVNGLTSGGKL
jgi:acetyl esterase/lipase